MSSPSPAAAAPAAHPNGTLRAVAGLLLVVACALLASAASTWHIARSTERRLRIERRCGEICHLDEVLTMSANMAAATSEPRWQARYDAHVTRLDRAIAELREVSPQVFDAELGADTEVANTRLVARERDAFGLVAAGRPAAARAILDGDDYRADKEAYAIGIQRAQEALSRIAASEQANASRLGVVLVMATVLLAAAGLAMHSRLRQRLHASRVAAELAHARAEAAAEQAANRKKSAFVANISHELRTPLTAILGFAEMLHEGGTEDSARVDAAGAIVRQGQHLLQVVNDLLDMSKLEAGRVVVQRESCDPARLIEDVLSSLRVRAKSKQLALERTYASPLPRRIDTDPVRFRQILVNLIGNALKFTAAGEVRVIVTAVTEGPQPHLAIAVQDTGIGMTEAQRQRLFQPFVQADETTERRFGGTGLGLAIARNYAQLLGGDLTVVSEPGHGSTFTFTLALAAPIGATWNPDAEPDTPPAAAATGEPLPSLADLRVLLAEDGEDNQRLIRALLQRAGAKVTVAADGQQALDQLQAPSPAFDVLLLDMHMPRVDGYQVAERLRAAGSRLPIVALTANAMQGDREHCLAAGCDDYLSKPIDRRRLLQVCASWTRARRDH